MSDAESGGDQTEEKKFSVDRAKTGRATCKKCKEKLAVGELRLAKHGYNPFGPQPMKQWHHVACLFEVFGKQRASTARINNAQDIEGFSDLEEEDRNEILSYLPESARNYTLSKKPKPKDEETPKKAKKNKATGDEEAGKSSSKKVKAEPGVSDESRNHKDNSFREFRRMCGEIAAVPAYTDKTAALEKFFTQGTDGESFKGDLLLWVRLLLPQAVKRVYNLQSKQIVRLFSRIFHVDHDEMLEDLEQGDVAETVGTFFEKSKHCQPARKSALSLYDVDEFLQKLSTMTKEDEQTHHFKQIAKKCTSNDLKMVIRLIKHDLRINAGPKHILGAVHPDAYEAFQSSRDIEAVISQATGSNKKDSGDKDSSKKKGSINIGITIMTPVLPMLAEACKSTEFAMKKCPNGMISEIKYDGERVQVHKQGNEFKYFSRSLKPVMAHKISHFKDYIPEAFPHGNDLILDSEILMIDTNTGKPLPFGTLGKHKKEALKDANVCLFIFDCIYYNGEVLMDKPIKHRKKVLQQVMTEIPNRIMFSEMEEIHKPEDLESMLIKVFKQGLEGLVLKDLMSTYEPGKRHWLKVKKDYLSDGAMADSADLVVLGAWFGTGQKGGMMSVFLMGCYDKSKKKWCTVTKVHTGHDDKTLERLQTELQDLVVKISKEASKVPDWLSCTKTMIPDFVAKDPKVMPVWEITGAEFTKHDVHTANGISIRFPRVTKIRHDKNWKMATSLSELEDLYKKSKDCTDFTLPPSSPKPDSSNSKDSNMSELSTSKAKTQKNVSDSPKLLSVDENTAKNDELKHHESKTEGKESFEKKQKHRKKRKLDSTDSDEKESEVVQPKKKISRQQTSVYKSKELVNTHAENAVEEKVNENSVSGQDTNFSTTSGEIDPSRSSALLPVKNYDSFAKYISSEMKFIKDDDLNLSTKRKILAAIYEAQEIQISRLQLAMSSESNTTDVIGDIAESPYFKRILDSPDLNIDPSLDAQIDPSLTVNDITPLLHDVQIPGDKLDCLSNTDGVSLSEVDTFNINYNEAVNCSSNFSTKALRTNVEEFETLEDSNYGKKKRDSNVNLNGPCFHPINGEGDSDITDKSNLKNTTEAHISECEFTQTDADITDVDNVSTNVHDEPEEASLNILKK